MLPHLLSVWGVKIAIAALEDAGFIERGMNYPRIYATSILSKNMTEAVINLINFLNLDI